MFDLEKILPMLIGTAVVVVLVAWRGYFGPRRQLTRLTTWATDAHAAFDRGDHATAEKLMRRCVDEEPLWIYGRFGLARILAAQQKFAEAEEQYRFAADLTPGEADAWVQLGLFYLTMPIARVEDASKALERACALDPDLRHKLGKHEIVLPHKHTPPLNALLAPADSGAPR